MSKLSKRVAYLFTNVSENLQFFRFPGGISNGAAWYSLDGGMQDWNYLQAQTFEITVEMGCRKYPDRAELLQKYYDHYPAIMNHVKNSRQGFWGRVTDSAGSAIENTVVSGIGINITARPDGQYWRVAAPGNYSVTFSADGFSDHVHHLRVGRVNWAQLADPLSITLIMKRSDIVNHGTDIDRETRIDMITRRYVVVCAVVIFTLTVCVAVGLWRRKSRREELKRMQDVEYRGLIQEGSDSE